MTRSNAGPINHAQSLPINDAKTSGIDGQFRPEVDKIVRRKFGAVAKVLWPIKTDAHVASIANVNVRTARRWLAGEFEPPVAVIAAVIVETFKVE